MTSANVTHYEIYNQDLSTLIATDSQHCMCKDSITETLEQWEKNYPDALLCLRWPDECEEDQYLTFEKEDGYDMGFDPEVFMENERDTITLSAFMRCRRIKAIESEKNTIEYLRKILKEHTGNQSAGDHKMRKAYNEFKNKAEETAALIGHRVKAHCHIDEDGEFRCSYSISARTIVEISIANEAIKDFLATGLDNRY